MSDRALCAKCNQRPTPPRGGSGPRARYCLHCAKDKGQRWDRTLRRIAERDGAEAAKVAAVEGGVSLPADLRSAGDAGDHDDIVAQLEEPTGDVREIARLNAEAWHLVAQLGRIYAARGDVEMAGAAALASRRYALVQKELPGGIRQLHQNVEIRPTLLTTPEAARAYAAALKRAANEG